MTIKSIVMAAALLAAATQPAAAQVGSFSTCHGRVTCATLLIPLDGPGLGKVIHLLPGDPDRIAKWESFCRPTGVVDSEGVTRMRYAHEGCENGRTE